MPQVIFIIGVNGVGKSTLIPLLSTRLAGKPYEIHDFDERGVPDNADSNWRRTETNHWLEVAKENFSKEVSTIICGYSKPKEIDEISKQVGMDPRVYLLDANEEELSKRIMSRYQTPESLQELQRTTGKAPEKFLQDNVYVSKKFRDDAEELGYIRLDVSGLTPEGTANAVMDLIA